MPVRLLAAAALLSSLGCATARPAPALNDPARASEEGQRAMKQGRTEDAIAAFRRALAISPSDVDAMRGLVEAHFRAGKIDLLCSELERSLAVRPDDSLAHYGLGMAYFARGAAFEAKAVEHLGRAAELRPDSAEYQFRLGVVHLEAERYPLAVECLKKARDLDPSRSRHHVSLAQALARIGDRKGAIEELRAILALDPDAHDLRVAHKLMDRLNDPFREFPKAIEPDFQRGLEAMEKADAPQQAAVTFEEILEKFPDLAVVHAALGLCYYRIEDSGRAMDEFRRATELSPQDARNFLYIGDLYFAKDRYDRAADAYRSVVERDPLSDHAYERLGAIALQAGDYAQAARWLKPLTVLRPDDPATHIGYSSALHGQGNLEGAQRELEQILNKDPKNLEALSRLGTLLAQRRMETKDPVLAKALGEQAARCFEAVLDQQPQNVYAAKMLQSLK